MLRFFQRNCLDAFSVVGWLVDLILISIQCFPFQTVIKLSQIRMPPELIGLFKAKMMAEILLSSQIFINSSGYNFFNGISEDLCMLKILTQVTDLEKERSDLNYRMGSCGSIVVALWYFVHFFFMGAVDG